MGTDVGKLVVHPGVPGIARIGEIKDGQVRLDLFESAAQPIVESQWRPLREVSRVRLSAETRVFFQDADQNWRAGRIYGGGPDVYGVRPPNSPVDIPISEDRLRVRWERPTQDPLQVLLTGANESPRYRDVREPVRQLLLAERAATASATGIMSSGVRLHAHQISAALRIIRDPVQRYLLADEVGMGKTIQAGFVMRQLLLDEPGRRIGILAPSALMAQWRAELLNKFYLGDFRLSDGRLPFEIVAHNDTDRWADLSGVDLLVIDEAHVLARTGGPQDSPYRELADLAHAVPRLLMLTATPFARSSTTHLALLHLLDPQLFRWENREEFERLLLARRELALAIFGLDEEPDADLPELLQAQFDEIRKIIPHDEMLADAMDRAMRLYGPPGTDPETVDTDALRRAVATVRTHVSETYRLHHRVIRNRRHVIGMERLDDEGLLTPFNFAGRARPTVRRLGSLEANAAATVLAQWASGSSAAVLDDDLDPAAYGLVLGVLLSRVGGPARDLLAALDYRVNAGDTDVLLPAEKAILDAVPALRFETNLIEVLRESTDTDGLQCLAESVTAACARPGAAIVFCGRGTLATDLAAYLTRDPRIPTKVYAHLNGQSEQDREGAVAGWRATGGILITDDSGDVGRNFQDATLVIHARIPWNPSAMEQRIGRVDRYSDRPTAQQLALADADRHGLVTAWLKLLANAFRIFDESVSAMQEAVDELTGDVWATALTDGIEGFLARTESIESTLSQEKRRINEIDALESSYGTHADGAAMALAIAQYEEQTPQIERAYISLIEGDEGLRLDDRRNRDGSITFERKQRADPLVSARLLRRLMRVDAARTGFFDRWKLTPTRRLFRRGNPFIDGIESLLDLDDRGQAVALWRLNRTWQQEPLAFFGFDFLVEADLDPILTALGENRAEKPVARRRADGALPPMHHRVWVPANATSPVGNPSLAGYLSEPRKDTRDTNLNPQRVAALHTLVGGAENLESVARACYTTAREHLNTVADLVDASLRAAQRVREETEHARAQSGARSQTTGLVSDPNALEAEIEIDRAIEAAVATPSVRVSTISCVVIAAQSWTDYV
ncbi:restriction endonuclease subunit R [Mycobacterium sp. CBMA 234]|nr:restriction endonuclease subunit R [Mycolicibacterium sp. CBMA 234]